MNRVNSRSGSALLRLSTINVVVVISILLLFATRFQSTKLIDVELS